MIECVNFYSIIQSRAASASIIQSFSDDLFKITSKSEGEITNSQASTLRHVCFLENLQKDEDEVRRYQQSVEAIQKPTVTGQAAPRVFDGDAALE